jgi:hypothetical protein
MAIESKKRTIRHGLIALLGASILAMVLLVALAAVLLMVVVAVTGFFFEGTG